MPTRFLPNERVLELDCRLSSVHLAKHHLVRTLVPSQSNVEYLRFSIYPAESDVSVVALRILFQTMKERGNNGCLPGWHVVLVYCPDFQDDKDRCQKWPVSPKR